MCILDVLSMKVKSGISHWRLRPTLAIVDPEVDPHAAPRGDRGVSFPTAKRLVAELAAFDLRWFEEPLPWTMIERYGELRSGAAMPIAGGEHFHNRFDYKPLFATLAVDVIQPDLCIAGGFTEVRKIAAQADAVGIPVAFHNSNSPLCTTATAHLALATRNFSILETFDALIEPHVFEALPGVLPLDNGHIGLPGQPGLGVELRDEVFAEHPPTGQFWNLFTEGWKLRDRSAR